MAKITHLQFHALVTYSQRARREFNTDRVRTSLLDWGSAKGHRQTAYSAHGYTGIRGRTFPCPPRLSSAPEGASQPTYYDELEEVVCRQLSPSQAQLTISLHQLCASIVPIHSSVLLLLTLSGLDVCGVSRAVSVSRSIRARWRVRRRAAVLSL